MISYRYSDPKRLPTVETRVRYHGISDRFFFREYDENGKVTRSGQVDEADLPVEVQDMARHADAGGHWSTGVTYIHWKAGKASILED